MTRLWSAAMTGAVHDTLAKHLLRADGSEEVAAALYAPSTGELRTTALLSEPVLPRGGERFVHRTAAFTTQYVLRVAQLAASHGSGLALMHSHPLGRGWQGMSTADQSTEASYANLAREITGQPMIGLTLAGDSSWSTRAWDRGYGRSVGWSEGENTRVFRHDRLDVSWNDKVRPVPVVRESQTRTVHCWGPQMQANIARLRVLVVGVGSVGLTVALALAATGIENIVVMDPDTVRYVNLDRLLGATVLDAATLRSKASLALRLLANAATAAEPKMAALEESVCEPAGLREALDFDVIFSCVDRPWPRHVLNTLAYADLIPVVDGGIHVDPFPNGGMRGATWRSHVAGPGRPCLACLRQYELQHVALEMDGSLEVPAYIEGLPPGHPLRVRQNISLLAVNCAGALLAQFISLIVHPADIGAPDPLIYRLAPHQLARDRTVCIPRCPFPAMIATGNSRTDPSGRHEAAESARQDRVQGQRSARVRTLRAIRRISEALGELGIRNAS